MSIQKIKVTDRQRLDLRISALTATRHMVLSLLKVSMPIVKDLEVSLTMTKRGMEYAFVVSWKTGHDSVGVGFRANDIPARVDSADCRVKFDSPKIAALIRRTALDTRFNLHGIALHAVSQALRPTDQSKIEDKSCQ